MAAAKFAHVLLLVLLLTPCRRVLSEVNACASDLELLLTFDGSDALGWTGISSEADWKLAGVTCEEGRVTEIDFGSKILETTLPETWSNLTALHFIDGTDNRFLGRLPPSWSTLTSMTFFGISGQQLTGPLPPEYSTWTELNSFLLDGNQLDGPLPRQYSSWSALKWLAVFDNSLTGGLPPEYSVMVEMEMLEVDMNPLGGTIPPQYSTMTRMTEVYFEGTEVEGKLPNEFSTWVDLEIFQVAGNWLTGTLPPSYSQFAWLSRVDFTDNPLTGTLPVQWSAMGLTQVLRVSNTQVTGMLPPEWSALKVLQELDFEGAERLIGTIPQEWGQGLSGLKMLYLPPQLYQYGCVPESLLDAVLRTVPSDAVIPSGCLDGWKNKPMPMPYFNPVTLGLADLSVRVSAAVLIPTVRGAEGRRRLQLFSIQQWEDLSRTTQEVVTLFVEDITLLARGASPTAPAVVLQSVEEDGAIVNIESVVHLVEVEDAAEASFETAISLDSFPSLSNKGFSIQKVDAVVQAQAPGANDAQALPVGVIVGIVAAALLCVAVGAGIAVLLLKRRKNTGETQHAEVDTTSEMAGSYKGSDEPPAI